MVKYKRIVLIFWDETLQEGFLYIVILIGEKKLCLAPLYRKESWLIYIGSAALSILGF